MDLLVCVINDDSKLNALLAGFVDIGIPGATVLKSQGMGRRLGDELPALAGLQELLAHARPENTTVFSVIEDRAMLDVALDLVQQVCGDLHAPATGIAFTVPVGRVIGLAPELDAADESASDGKHANPGGA